MEEGKDLPARVNPFAQRQTAGGLISVEQQRAIAEVQAAMIVARSMPRDLVVVRDMIAQDCTDLSLAEEAEYEYSRGGTKITGPSIRVLEACARRWGNMESGVREVSRHDGFSDCEAYAWDMETGYRDKRGFIVKHWRDTKTGGYQLTDERDIYELTMNQGQRRKRAAMEAIIPKAIVDDALRQCQITLKTKIDITPESIAAMVKAFAAFEVSKEHIEKRIQRHMDAITPALVIQLRRIYNSLKDGMSSPAEWFDIQVGESTEKTASGRKKPQAKKEPEPNAAETKENATGGADAQAGGSVTSPSAASDATAKQQQTPDAAAPTVSGEQISQIEKKLVTFEITKPELCRAFGIQSIGDLKAALFAGALRWIGDPTQAPQQ